MTEGHFDQISADKNQLGFEYQDLVCLELLIDLKPGETIGLEVLDDVHHEKIDGTNSLIQVKHSVDDQESITNNDLDLWKTLYNWSNSAKALNNKNIKFIFFTNRKITSKDGIVKILSAQNKDVGSLIEIISNTKKSIDEREARKKSGATENPIKKYVDHINSMEKSKKTFLFERVTMVFSQTEIIERISKRIEQFAISEPDALDVTHQLIGAFKDQKYKLVKSGIKLNIDYETFRKRFQFNRIIKISRDKKIDFSRYHQFKDVNTIDPKNGLFAKQLSDIDISEDEITDYAIEYAATSMFIQKLIIDGEFSEIESRSIDEEISHSWKTVHGKIYNLAKIESNDDHKRAARDCLYNTKEIDVEVANSPLSKAMITGKSIELSDRKRIGWRKDWREIYGEIE